MCAKALIAMSGGVDSSVAALLTLREGIECIGGTMRLWDGEKCGSSSDADDAHAVAERLGIPHYVFDCREEFEERVIGKFIRCYECGATPNPCIDCNRFLKFGELLRLAEELGCESIVSGHYARIDCDPVTGRMRLRKAADPAKDQTYFLAGLTQEQLAQIRMPLGELTKPEVRRIAEEAGFLNARKRDSQDICFVPDGDYGAFMERHTGKIYPAGDFIGLDGKKVGIHRGAVRYTIGQRKGLGLAMGSPVYVCAKDMERNTVTIGPESAVFSGELRAEEMNWISIPEPEGAVRVTAKTRHSQREQTGTAYPLPDGKLRLVFDAPQRAVTPGQAVVLYDGDLVLAGGTITE